MEEWAYLEPSELPKYDGSFYIVATAMGEVRY